MFLVLWLLSMLGPPFLERENVCCISEEFKWVCLRITYWVWWKNWGFKKLHTIAKNLKAKAKLILNVLVLQVQSSPVCLMQMSMAQPPWLNLIKFFLGWSDVSVTIHWRNSVLKWTFSIFGLQYRDKVLSVNTKSWWLSFSFQPWTPHAYPMLKSSPTLEASAILLNANVLWTMLLRPVCCFPVLGDFISVVIVRLYKLVWRHCFDARKIEYWNVYTIYIGSIT